MERIKVALQKARSEAGDGMRPLRQVSRVVLSQMPLTYTRTRHVELKSSTLEANRIIALDRRNPVTARFDMLRTKLLRTMDDNGWRTLAVTSPSPESGKTTVAINLAISISRLPDRTVLLMDYDLRRPKLAQCLGLSGGRSLNEVLSGNSTLADALIHPCIPRLIIAPAYRAEADPAELLSSDRTSAMTREISKRYADRVVLLDLPPLLGVDHALAVIPQVDCVLLVVGDGHSTQPEIRESLRLIPGDKLLGTVLNDSDGGGSVR